MSALAASDRSAKRLLAGARRDRRPVTLVEHRRMYGDVEVDPRATIELIARAGLRGRGGAGFPTARKLEAVRESGRRAIVVVNGAEGEPVAAKDKTLLAYVPHLVLDGAVLAARAVRAREAIVAVAPQLVDTVRRAIAERDDGRLELRVSAVPETFVAGEETALVSHLNGGDALPTFTPPRPYERGVRGLPTLVQNAETLAHVALIARHGPDWFRSVGTAEEPGTTLVSVSGAVRRPGVTEIPHGEPLASVLEAAGGVRGTAAAFLVGGYFGTWIGAAGAEGLLLSDADLGRYGASLGARAVVVLAEGMCGVRETARITRYLAAESAGQCGPCVHGLAAVADDFEQLLVHQRRVDRPRLEQRLAMIAGRGACRHPDGAVRLAASGLRVFSSDVDRHLRGHRCEAGRR